MSAQPNEVEVIRQRMARIRRKHHEQVHGLIAGAEVVAGWGRRSTLYAGAALGAAAVAALLLAARPKRTLPLRPFPSAADETPVAVIEAQIGETTRLKPRASWLGGAWSFMLSVAARAAQSYAAYRVEQWMVKQRESRVVSRVPGQAVEAQSPNGRPADHEPETRSADPTPIESHCRRTWP